MKRSGYCRINVTLPASTIELLDSVANRGGRSALIDDAVKAHAKRTLRERLREGAIVNAERDLAIAREWAAIDHEEY